MNTLAFVPVRGGSKAIPGKNVRPFCGRPLVWWTLRALEDSARVDRVVVSTDCPDVMQIVESFEFTKVEVWRRGEASATDRATTESAMLEFLEATRPDPSAAFVLVQATSPFTTADDFDRALARFEEGSTDSMLSCVRLRRFFWSDDGHAINYDPDARPRRQDFDGTLMENGAFYVSTIGRVLASKNRISGSIEPFEMPPHTALELDEPEDWEIGELLMRKHAAARGNRRAIRLVLTDVDGVLTDGGMYYSESGDELKRFNTLDGKAFELLRDAGIETGIVTAENVALNAARARKVKADHVFQGVTDKLGVVTRLCAERGFDLSEVAYIGDDLNDLELLLAVGWSACPATATDRVRAVVDHVCEREGGRGCLREWVDRVVIPATQEGATTHADVDRTPERI
ncbi:MAG: acylneuraminate cytidylyltransferase [Planctomycetes bacterium]|nr:acylneuraminate cytidylyltransferase [Planctomycetota bacterium]